MAEFYAGGELFFKVSEAPELNLLAAGIFLRSDRGRAWEVFRSACKQKLLKICIIDRDTTFRETNIAF